jgi:hypothetical protein
MQNEVIGQAQNRAKDDAAEQESTKVSKRRSPPEPA